MLPSYLQQDEIFKNSSNFQVKITPSMKPWIKKFGAFMKNDFGNLKKNVTETKNDNSYLQT